MTIKLTYFGGKGRAEPCRLAFHIGGVAFEDERINFEQFMALKPKLPFGTVPAVTVDNVQSAQSAAILRYAGKLGGLYPADPVQALQVPHARSLCTGPYTLPVAAVSLHQRDTGSDSRVCIQHPCRDGGSSASTATCVGTKGSGAVHDVDPPRAIVPPQVDCFLDGLTELLNAISKSYGMQDPEVRKAARQDISGKRLTQ